MSTKKRRFQSGSQQRTINNKGLVGFEMKPKIGATLTNLGSGGDSNNRTNDCKNKWPGFKSLRSFSSGKQENCAKCLTKTVTVLYSNLSCCFFKGSTCVRRFEILYNSLSDEWVGMPGKFSCDTYKVETKIKFKGRGLCYRGAAWHNGWKLPAV